MIQISEDKLGAVAALRIFCGETFGVIPGLRESVALVDSMIPSQESRVRKNRFEVIRGLKGITPRVE